MKDYVEQFRQKRLRKNVIIISFWLAFALVVNWLIFGTDVGNKLQTSVKNANSGQQIKMPDLYLKTGWTWSDVINLINWNSFDKVSQISFSLASNPDSIKINNIITEDKNVELIQTNNVPWYYMIILKFKNPQNILTNSNLLKIMYTKIWEDKSSINLLETQFLSDWQTFELQNRWLEF